MNEKISYSKEFYNYLNGDLSPIGYEMKRLSGPDIISFGKRFGFPYEYIWGGVNLSRWDYMSRLVQHVATVKSLDVFFHEFFINSIQRPNLTKEEVVSFFKDINGRLQPYGQKLVVKENKIMVENVDPTFVLRDIEIDLGQASKEGEASEALMDGGQATIFSTSDPNVLKKQMRITKSTSEKEKQRFINEYNFMNMLRDSKYVLPVFDLDSVNYSYLMPRATTFEAASKSMDDFQFGQYILQVAQAILYMHRNGIFHRDLSLNNTLLHDGRWVLNDFGFSKGDEISVNTTTGVAYGKEGHIHPEILNDLSLWKNYEYRFDYFSFGFMITKVIPYISNEELRSKLSDISTKLTNKDIKLNVEDFNEIIKGIKTLLIEF